MDHFPWRTVSHNQRVAQYVHGHPHKKVEISDRFPPLLPAASLGSPNCPTREEPSKEILRQRKTFTQPARTVLGKGKWFWMVLDPRKNLEMFITPSKMRGWGVGIIPQFLRRTCLSQRSDVAWSTWRFSRAPYMSPINVTLYGVVYHHSTTRWYKISLKWGNVGNPFNPFFCEVFSSWGCPDCPDNHQSTANRIGSQWWPTRSWGHVPPLLGNPANPPAIEPMKVSRELYPFSYRPEMVFFWRVLQNGFHQTIGHLAMVCRNRLSSNLVKTHRLWMVSESVREIRLVFHVTKRWSELDHNRMEK